MLRAADQRAFRLRRPQGARRRAQRGRPHAPRRARLRRSAARAGSNRCSAAAGSPNPTPMPRPQDRGNHDPRRRHRSPKTPNSRDAVDLMLRRRVKRLPVLRGGAVVGVISRSDLLKGCFGAAAQRPRRIRTRRSARRSRANSTARRGRRAPRSGSRSRTATSRSTARSPTSACATGLRVIAENTPGVNEVHDRLAWIEPNSGFLIPATDDTRT